MQPLTSYKSHAVVLYTLKYGESSLVVFMLTDAVGRQSFMVQGVKGSGRKGRAALFQPMMPLEIVGLESSRMQMHRIKEVRMGFPLGSVPFDVVKSTIALFMAETLYRLVKECEPESPLFDFIYAAVGELDTLRDGVANYHLWFLVQLSRYLGFYPGNEYERGMSFDVQEGHFVAGNPSHGQFFPPTETALMAEFMETAPADLGAIRLNREMRSSLLSSLLGYFGYHLDSVHQIRSVDILRDVF